MDFDTGHGKVDMTIVTYARIDKEVVESLSGIQ